MIVTVNKIPFRLKRGSGPLTLEVNIRNNASTPRKYMVSIETGPSLSTKPSGPARYETKRTQLVLPGEKTVVSFKVYARPVGGEKDTIKITVDECIDDYNNVVLTREVETTVDII